MGEFVSSYTGKQIELNTFNCQLANMLKPVKHLNLILDKCHSFGQSGSISASLAYSWSCHLLLVKWAGFMVAGSALLMRCVLGREP